MSHLICKYHLRFNVLYYGGDDDDANLKLKEPFKSENDLYWRNFKRNLKVNLEKIYTIVREFTVFYIAKVALFKSPSFNFALA